MCHVITGATGVIGAALTLQLAADTDDEMLCCVRPAAAGPVERLHAALQRTAFDCLLPSRTLVTAQHRTRVLPLDLTCGLPTELPMLPRGCRVRFWHAAQVRSTLLSPGADAAGSARAVELARRLGATEFNHFSTVHVAGHHQGTIHEGTLRDPAPRNAYEAGRIASEHLLSTVTDMLTRTLRVADVVGHSITLRYPGHARGLLRAQSLLARHLQAGTTTVPHRAPMRVLASGTGLVHVVPLDLAVRQAVALHLASTDGGVYHLVNTTETPFLSLLHALVANAGGAAPVLVQDPRALSPADRRLHRMLAAYAPYADSVQHFDRGRTDLALGGGSQWTWPVDLMTLKRLLKPFVWR